MPGLLHDACFEQLPFTPHEEADIFCPNFEGTGLSRATFSTFPVRISGTSASSDQRN
jgi:hypothetical protein